MTKEPGEKIDSLANAVMGAAIEVHRILGPGFLECVYQAALAVELSQRGISFEREKHVAVDYKGHSVGDGRLDLFVGSCLVVELKTVESLAPIHTAQVLSYLKTLRLPLGLLINFNASLLKNGIKRVVFSEPLGDLGVLAVRRGNAG
ncbi:MAG: GxxExxY protein [Sinobacteraceae bacterium]|nr:GxxExxY protein [Nevskiaceae bacterium]